jgi:ABC-type lipoprotein export system ATPase subunit
VGEQQRARRRPRTRLNRIPELILADEPTSALDDENCASVFELLTPAGKQNATPRW